MINTTEYQFEILRDVCNKCHQDVQKKSKPTFSSLAGFDFGVPIPECLKNMTLAEEALIARIQTVIKLTKLKANRYCYTIDGPISFIDRTNSTLEVANVLPRLPSDIDWIVLRNNWIARTSSSIKIKDLKCRRHVIQAALNWLIENSPAYEDVSLSIENLQHIPIDGYIEPHAWDTDDAIREVLQDLGPAPDQGPQLGDISSDGATDEQSMDHQHQSIDVGAADFATEFQGIIQESPQELAVAQEIREQFLRLRQQLSQPESQPEPGQTEALHTPIIVRAPPSQNTYISWRHCPFFFSKAFPTVFMPCKVLVDGVEVKDSPSDFTRRLTREKSIKYFEWAQHLHVKG